jgi:thymidylate kinase
MIILIDGLPGSGKSTILRNLKEKIKDVCVYEFHSKRKIITEGYGFSDGRESCVKEIEDKLENFLLNSRFIDGSEEFEKIKLELLKERLNELNREDRIIKEGLFACLIDKCSDEFIENVRKFIEDKFDKIIFLDVNEKELGERQRRRVLRRKGVYDDKTNKERNELFLKQFNEITKNIKGRIVFVDNNNRIEETVEEVLKLI